jgi:ribonuclease P protein component
LRKRVLLKEYEDLIKTGRRFFSPLYVVYAKPYDELTIRPAVKKKVGNAVKRNKEKRRIRVILKKARFKTPQLVLAILLKNSNLSFLERKQILLQSIRPLLVA